MRYTLTFPYSPVLEQSAHFLTTGWNIYFNEQEYVIGEQFKIAV